MEQQSPQIKICPYCHKEIDVLATKCPYCQSKLKISPGGILIKLIPNLFPVLLVGSILFFSTFAFGGNSNNTNSQKYSSQPSTAPAPTTSTQQKTSSKTVSTRDTTPATSEQTTLTYAPVSISTLIENADNPTFAHNNGGGESAPLASFVEVKGKVSKIFPDNWFLLQDPSGNIVVITAGGGPDTSTKVKQIILGNSLVIDGAFVGSIKTLLNKDSLPPSISFMSSLPTSTPWLMWSNLASSP